MKIQKINNQYNSNPAFTSLRLREYDKAGNIINCHYTNMNRADLNWGKFAKFLDKRFAGQEKVNINFFGCSDGSDVYTLVLNMFKELGNRAKKFFPILASDISPDVVKNVNEGKILLHKKDLEFIDKMNARDFFERNNKEKVHVMGGIEFIPYIVNDSLRRVVQTSVKDVRKSVKTDDFSDGVFIFRNGWTFNTLGEQNEIAKGLSEHSNEKTLAVIGQSDLFKSNASEYMQRNGFRGIKSDIFTEAETDYPSKTIGIPPEKSKYPEFILFEKDREPLSDASEILNLRGANG